jgi:hypothetical protein
MRADESIEFRGDGHFLGSRRIQPTIKEEDAAKKVLYSG